MLAFGDSDIEAGVSKPCDSGFTAFVDNLSLETNKILVTHSTCIDTLTTDSGDFLLGFSTKKQPHYAISAFVEKDSTGNKKVLGCMWPNDWARLAETKPSTFADISQAD